MGSGLTSGHFDLGQGGLRAATRLAFENLVHRAISEKVNFVLLCGDLLDGTGRNFGTGLWLSHQLGRLHKHGIPTFIILGNHDAESAIIQELKNTWPTSVKIFSSRKAETEILAEIGVALHGKSFPNREVGAEFIENYPKGDSRYFNIGLLHTSLAGYQDHDSYAPCHLDQLRSFGYQYWALGHVHNRQVLSDDPWIIYPGNLQGRQVKETGAKGAYLVAVGDNGEATPEFIPLDVARWFRVVIDAASCDSIEDAIRLMVESLETLREESNDKPSAVRFEVSISHLIKGEIVSDYFGVQNLVRASCLSRFGDSVWVESVIWKSLQGGNEEKSTSVPPDLRPWIEKACSSERRESLMVRMSTTILDLSRKSQSVLGEDAPKIPFSPDLVNSLIDEARLLLGGSWKNKGKDTSEN